MVQLGADTPADSFVEAARDVERLVAVGVTVTWGGNQSAVGRTVAALHQAGIAPVVLGGQGLDGTAPADLAIGHLGADLVIDPRCGTAEALAQFDQLAADAQRVRRRARRSGS